MRYFDHDYAGELMQRLGAIPVDRKPAWGTLTPVRLVYHLDDVFRYSMGKGSPDFYRGNFLTRYIAAPLILNGIMPIPRNVKVGSALGQPRDSEMPEALETLQVTIDNYLTAVQDGSMTPFRHPAFGPIGVDGWGRMHIRHCDHHCKQFGV